MYFVRFFLRSLALCFALLCVFGAAEAAPQTIEAQGVHIMGDNDSPKAAKDMARKDAMRIAVEKAGVYVESYSKTQNMKLTADEVRTLSGAILKVTDEKDVPELTEGVWKYTVYLTAEVDTDGIDLKTMMESIKRISTVYRKSAMRSRSRMKSFGKSTERRQERSVLTSMQRIISARS